jgi:uncharacterized protein (DUF362 family)
MNQKENNIVSIVNVVDDIFQTVNESMELADWKNHIKKGKDIALKINLGWDIFIPGSITSPLVTEGVIRTIYDYVDKIFIIESDQVLENIEAAFYRSNTKKICEKYSKVSWYNMSKNEMIKIHLEDNYILKDIEIPKILSEIDFITIPVMKTHNKTTMTGAVKNQWGCLSKLRHEYHLVLNEALSDINSIVKPKFAVMDATIALEGCGPKNGNPKEMNLILASSDIVAVDTVAAKIMGFNSSKIEHLALCSKRGLGTNNIQKIIVLGEKIEDHETTFMPAKHNLVSKLEIFFRKSFLKKVLFNTPIFLIALRFGKLYYKIWFHLKGKAIWKKCLTHPLYGTQWLGNEYTNQFLD